MLSLTRIIVILIALSGAAQRLKEPRPALLPHELASIGVLGSHIILRRSSHHLPVEMEVYVPLFSFVNDWISSQN